MPSGSENPRGTTKEATPASTGRRRARDGEDFPGNTPWKKLPELIGAFIRPVASGYGPPELSDPKRGSLMLTATRLHASEPGALTPCSAAAGRREVASRLATPVAVPPSAHIVGTPLFPLKLPGLALARLVAVSVAYVSWV